MDAVPFIKRRGFHTNLECRKRGYVRSVRVNTSAALHGARQDAVLETYHVAHSAPEMNSIEMNSITRN